MSTIRDVARLANVSVATVSRVLNGSQKVSQQSRDAVLRAQAELGFSLNVNARTLARQDSEIIGVTVSDLSDPYFGSMVKACENAAQQIGCTLLVCQGFHDAHREIQAIETLLSHRCRGMIVHALNVSDEQLIDYMQRCPTMVLVNRQLKVPGHPDIERRCLNVDNTYGEYLVVSKLIEAGHRRIAYAGSCHDIDDAYERLDGYKKALQEHGIPFDSKLVTSDQPSMEGGMMTAQALLPLIADCIPELQAGNIKPEELPFSAVAVYNDTMAVGLMSVLSTAGLRIPEDISVTGFDDSILARCYNPPLSTVINPVEEMAEYAVHLADALYKKEADSLARPELNLEFIDRMSVRRLKR